MIYDYEHVEDVVPERATKHGSCCNLWTEVPVDIGMDFELIRRRLRLAGFKDVTEYRFSEDRMMFLIRTIIDGRKGVPELDLQDITKITREVADGNRAPMRDPPRIFDRLEEKTRHMTGTGDVPATRRLMGALYEMELLDHEFDKRELVAAYIRKFQAALDRHRKRGHTPPDFTMWQVIGLIRKFWLDGDTGLFTSLLSDFEHDQMMDPVFESGTGGAEAREEYQRKQWGPASPEASEPEARPSMSRGVFGQKTHASLEGLRAALRR